MDGKAVVAECFNIMFNTHLWNANVKCTIYSYIYLCLLELQNAFGVLP